MKMETKKNHNSNSNRRPLELSIKLMSYLARNLLQKRSPLVTMLEPTEACNLSCEGCGRVREYHSIFNKRISVEESLKAVKESGAPIVSIAGGEPLLHPDIDKIVEGIIKDKRFVYLCTNGLLLESSLKKFKPSKFLCFVVHLDGMEQHHDRLAGRSGVFKAAVAAIEKALALGFRVCINTTIYKGSDVADLHRLFSMLTAMGIEGIMLSPAYTYRAISKEIFLERQESIKAFQRILDPSKRFRFYHNPLYLDFLRGKRTYQCAAWATPTYTPLGWRKPCYALADSHVQSIAELLEDSLWESYGPDKDPRCANCMMHSGFEPASILHALRHPRELLSMLRNSRKPRAKEKMER